MNPIGTAALAAVLALLTGMAQAGEYKTPANMSNADRQALMAGSNEYEQCVIAGVHKLAAKIGDPRVLADAAMASCSDKLTAFAEQMAADNYNPDFSNYYIRKIKHRAANSAVQHALIIASQRQSRSDSNSAQQPGTASE